MVQLSSIDYVAVGDTFSLECTATNDPQSPNMLEIRWFKGSTRIDNNRFYTVAEYRRELSYISLITTVDEVDYQYNGTYTCSIYDSMITTTTNKSTTYVVESRQLRTPCNFIVNTVVL